ncbi:DoxX family protein [Gordonia hydrophobica]|uniref:DoxX family protein n=1 Tax=Gordonia hydrophobica TaxID=40516 RepID=A0ABZ2U1W1_9ACTN|nr:DoxX family protein [Gordonia hydrophobica]MBM7367580.1 putative membrane protein YphA (DoxX/SURF4 family) [Gordonia hydrophobica]
MIIALWIVNAILAVLFLTAGAMKVVRTKSALADSGMAWTTDASVGQVKTIGALEVVGALGLILPRATDIAPVLSPLAAVGLSLTMVGAIALHVRRNESFLAPAGLLVVTVASAVLGFATL